MKFKYTQILNERDSHWECERNIGRKGERRPRARMRARLGHTARERRRMEAENRHTQKGAMAGREVKGGGVVGIEGQTDGRKEA